MEKYFVPSAQYWDEERFVYVEITKNITMEDFIEIPSLPFNLSNTDNIYSVDGNSIVLISEAKSLRYFSDNAAVCKISSKYCKYDNRYEYHSVNEDKAKSYVDCEIKMTSGEYLGSFDVAEQLGTAITLFLKKIKSAKNIKVDYNKLKATAEIMISKHSDDEVKINIKLRSGSIDLPGIKSMQLYSEGVLKSGIVLMLDIDQARDVARLSRYLKKDVRVRVSQSPDDPSEAVLTWQSSQIDGTAMTIATIVCL